MKIADFEKQSRDYWKGRISFVIFTNKCNYSCPFCYVPDIVQGKKTLNTKEVLEELRKVRGGIDSVVITGGEPCLQTDLPIFAKKLKLKDVEIKLWTNGSKPSMIKKMIDRGVVDHVSMDIKGPFSRYPKLVRTDDLSTEKVKESKELLEEEDVQHEFITTWSPDLTEEEILETASEVNTTWLLQKFEPKNCLEPSYSEKEGRSLEELEETAAKAEGPEEVRVKSGRMEKVIE